MNYSPLIDLAYLSKSTLTGNERDRPEEHVEQIVESARQFNSTLGVTGILLVGERCFAQILEGPAPAVDEVFEERVLPATSHTDVLRLSRKPTPVRAFQDWSMALVHDRTGYLDRLVEYRAWEIEMASALPEPLPPWPSDRLLDEISRIVGQVAAVPVETVLKDHAAPRPPRHTPA